jgi:hypothetical protein
MPRSSISVAAALVLLLAAGIAPGGQSTPQLLVHTPRARVAGAPEAAPLAQRVADIIEDSAPRIAQLLDTPDLRPIPAVVYRDRARFVAAAGLSRRSPVVGLAIFPAGVIHIDGTGRLAAIEKVVPHEVAHVIIARALGPSLPALPLWLNEGIAEYVAGKRAAQVDPASLSAVGRGDTIPLAELDLAFRGGGQRAQLAYVQAASLVNFLVDQRGEAVLASLLAALRATGAFPPALRQVTGWDLAQLESEWRRSLARRWRWPLLLQSPLLPFGLLLLVFFAALIRHLRERKRRQETPESDW